MHLTDPTGAGSPPPGDCILFATADWDTPYWTNKQHTAAHLAKAGWRVLYVESVGLRAPKVGSGTDWRRIAKRLWRGLQGPRQVQDRIWVISPLVIPFKHHHPWVRRFNQGFLAWTLARFCRQHQFRSPLLWTYHPFVLEQLVRMRERHGIPLGKLVYHCVDDLSAIPGIDAAAFNAEERRLLAQADAVFTTAQALFEKCRQFNSNVHNFPNVVDFEHFSKAHVAGPIPSELVAIPHPRLIYVGALSDFKVDFALLLQVAISHPEWHIVLVGSEREGQRDNVLAELALLPNVHHLGHRTYLQLPDYLRGTDVGLLPTRINDYTRSMFPMKFYEYIAAGLPVVSTPLAFVNEQSTGILVGGNASDFMHAIVKQIESGKLSLEESHAIVGEHTWSTRLKTMLTLI